MAEDPMRREREVVVTEGAPRDGGPATAIIVAVIALVLLVVVLFFFFGGRDGPAVDTEGDNGADVELDIEADAPDDLGDDGDGAEDPDAGNADGEGDGG